MRKLGILGGLAWRSTVDYYAGLCRRSEERPGAPSPPEMSIESLSYDEAAARIGTDDDEESWARFDEYHRSGLQRLEAAGADFALMASNTPHHRFEAIVRGVGIPVLNLFAVAARECARLGARRVLILGTDVTMRSAVFQAAFAEWGVEAEGPRDPAIRAAAVALAAGLRRGRVRGAAARIDGLVKSAGGRPPAPGSVACLACTELPLAFPDLGRAPVFERNGLTYLNASAAHVAAAFDYAAGGGGEVSEA